MLKAIIFDFDGVITDSEILHWRSFNSVLARYGAQIPKSEYYKTYLGLTDVDCYKLLIEQGLLKLDYDAVADLVAQKKHVFEVLAEKEGRIIDGVREFLSHLKSNNVRMAICSGALRSEIELILDDDGLRDFFETVVSAEDVNKGKPDPEAFITTLTRLNDGRTDKLDANQCVVIEDSFWGIRAAKSAGMRVVAVTNTYDARRLRGADVICDRLNELSIHDLQRLCA